MGPANNVTKTDASLPSRPKFIWDPKNASWKDGKGKEERHFKAVAEWCEFYDALSDSNSNKIEKKNRRIVVCSQLFGRERDLTKDNWINWSSNRRRCQKLLSYVCTRDPMSVISDVFTDFHSLIKTPRNNDETFKTFGSIFDAQFSKLKALGNNAKLSEPYLPFYLYQMQSLNILSEYPS